MATTSVLGTVYETLLCSPGMNEAVKIDVKINRKTILLLSNIIEWGLTENAGKNELLKLIPVEEASKLRELGDDCLNKAGLKDLKEKLSALNGQ